MTTRRNFLKALAALPPALSFRPGWAAGGGTPDPSRLALVIGNSAYSAAPLSNPANDARAIGTLLTQAGFTVDSHLDATRNGMMAAIEAFGAAVKRTETRQVVFYYAGHGAQLDWRNYLLPVDALVEKQEHIRQRCVDLALLLGQFSAAKDKTFVVILDACRNNPFGRAYRPEQQGLSQFDAPVGSLLAYATSPGNVASDGDGKNGLYTEHLVRELSQRNTRIEDALKRVRLNVRLASHGTQIPWETTSLESDVFIFNGEHKKLSEAELEQLVEADVTEWARIKSSKKIDDWVGYLRSFPNGRFAEIAQMRLTRLLADVERLAAEERQREEQRRQDEQKRLDDERIERERTRIAEEQRRAEEEKRLAVEREKLRLAEERRLAAERAKSEELARRQEEKLNLEARRRKEEERQERERQRLAEAERLARERKELERQQAAEAERLARESKQLEEQRQAAEQQRMERQKLAEAAAKQAPEPASVPVPAAIAAPKPTATQDRKPAPSAPGLPPAAAVALDIRAGMPVPALIAPSANPFSAGRYPLGRIYTVGDLAVIRQSDMLTGIEEAILNRRVTKVDHEEDRVEFNGGVFVTDLMGNPIKNGPISFDTPVQWTPAELQLGRKWTAAFRRTQNGRTTNAYYDMHIAVRETITVPAGRFDCFRIDGEGWNITNSARLELKLWLVPGINSPIRRDFMTRNRIGQFGQTERNELVSLRQQSIGAL
jgi:uncharacterized caspase-like protein